MGMKESMDRGTPSEGARIAITYGEMTTGGSTITWKKGDLMICISGTRGNDDQYMKCRRGVPGLVT